MYTVEEKLDLVMRYIATDDQSEFLDVRRKIKDALAAGGSPAHTQIAKTDVIPNLITEIGVPCHLLGYRMLCSAVELCVANDDYIKHITKGLYIDVARICNSTPVRVERAIRHAIEVAFDRCDISDIKRLFGNTVSLRSGKLTNSEFLAACMYEARRRMREAC